MEHYSLKNSWTGWYNRQDCFYSRNYRCFRLYRCSCYSRYYPCCGHSGQNSRYCHPDGCCYYYHYWSCCCYYRCFCCYRYCRCCRCCLYFPLPCYCRHLDFFLIHYSGHCYLRCGCYYCQLRCVIPEHWFRCALNLRLNLTCYILKNPFGQDILVMNTWADCYSSSCYRYDKPACSHCTSGCVRSTSGHSRTIPSNWVSICSLRLY